MKYICAQPATLYYAWQIDTMLFSFVNVGINLEDVHIVCAIHGDIHDHFNIMMQKYPGVTFSFYEDTRDKKSYIPNIQPHVFKKHFSAFPSLSEQTVFVHDADIVFTKPLDINSFVTTEDCYLSDTISYIGANYIKSKSELILEKMCSIVGIEKEVVEANQKNSGGAQYILNKVDKYYWYDVEKDAQRIFDEITLLSQEVSEDGKLPIQIWTAGMWSMLWNLWKRNKNTIVHDKMSFSWATSPLKNWHKNAIYHNAGITSSMKGSFYKGEYISKFPPLNLDIENKNCSYNYYNLLKQALSPNL